MDTSNKHVVRLVILVALSVSSFVKSQGDEAITIDPHWEDTTRDPNYNTVIKQSPAITNWGNWGRWAHCSMTNSFVTGFQLKVEKKDAEIDNTAVNGINLSCGIPEQKEVERISSVKGPWGSGRTRMFCEKGFATGFQLKVQKPQDRGIDDAATVNVRMLCEHGPILEGFDEQGDYYMDSVWSEPISCPHNMGVCGMQTQVESFRWFGDDTTLNNIRIKCCPILSPGDGQQEQETPTTSEAATTTAVESTSTEVTNDPHKFDLTVFQDHEGLGGNETLQLLQDKCNNLPANWQKQVGSISKETPCIRLWDGLDCLGPTRCYCDDNFLSFTENYTMTSELSWYNQLSSIGPCQLDENSVENLHLHALLFSDVTFEGEKTQIILAPGECLTFYEKDNWRGKINSVLVEKGCIRLYDGEQCTGDHAQIESAALFVGDKWANRTLAVRNCHEN